MAGWYHWLDGHESEWTPGDSDGQGGLVCCDSWGCKSWTGLSEWTELNWISFQLGKVHIFPSSNSFYWSIVYLQYFIGFKYTAFYSFFCILYFIIDYYKVLHINPCAIQLIIILFVHVWKDPDSGKDVRWEEKGTTGWDGWMVPLTQGTWIWVSSGGWWWTGRPGVLQFIWSQRVRHNWVTELNWADTCLFLTIYPLYLSLPPCFFSHKESQGQICVLNLMLLI